MTVQKSQKLGQVLVDESLITDEQLREALNYQKNYPDKKLGEIFVDLGLITEEQVAQILARIYDLPYVDLSTIVIDENLFGVLSSDVQRRFNMLPIDGDENSLTVVTNDPLDLAAIQEIQSITGHQINLAIAGRSDIRSYIEKYSEATQAGHAVRSSQDVDSQPVKQYVDSLIGKAIKERVSDIHLEPQVENMRVRFRIDGVLYEKAPIPNDMQKMVVSRIKILGGMDVADSRRPQDGRFSPENYPNYDLRLSTLPDVNGENMVLRILDKTFTDFSFESLGMGEEEIKTIERVIKQPYGIILVTGPTGSGKSTTLYSILSALNDVSRNIITVEDPVEYKIKGVNQTAINVRAGYTFNSAIRNILRHDPDIILIGEIRDSETADISIRSSMTGHLVLSTLHTNTAAGAIMRLLEMEIEPFLIRSSLIAVIAQRLVRRLCPSCSEEYTPSAETVAMMRKFIEVPEGTKLAGPKGCDKCFHTGFTGRAAMFESLILNEKIRDLILQDPNEGDITQLAIKYGMKTLRSAGLKKAVQKVTSLEEVLRITFSEEE